MGVKTKDSLRLTFHPMTTERWKDFETLFGKNGACGGCWCMWWRMTAAEFAAKKGDKNKRAMKAMVARGEVPGILAYHEGRAIGWCSIASREEFPRLERSRILKRIDDRPVWSIVCFYVKKEFRRRGVMEGLIAEAIHYAKKRKAKIVEGYPVDPKRPNTPDVFVYTGLAGAFRKAGFEEVERRSETRPVMRIEI